MTAKVEFNQRFLRSDLVFSFKKEKNGKQLHSWQEVNLGTIKNGVMQDPLLTLTETRIHKEVNEIGPEDWRLLWQ